MIFTYEPLAFRVGLVLMMLGLAASALVWWCSGRMTLGDPA